MISLIVNTVVFNALEISMHYRYPIHKISPILTTENIIILIIQSG